MIWQFRKGWWGTLNEILAVNQGAFIATWIWKGVKCCPGEEMKGTASTEHSQPTRYCKVGFPWPLPCATVMAALGGGNFLISILQVSKPRLWEFNCCAKGQELVSLIQFKWFSSDLSFLLFQHDDLVTYACLEADLIRLLLSVKFADAWRVLRQGIS